MLLVYYFINRKEKFLNDAPFQQMSDDCQTVMVIMKLDFRHTFKGMDRSFGQLELPTDTFQDGVLALV